MRSANEHPKHKREHGWQLHLALAFEDARLFRALRTLLLPAFNLNEPVQMHCSSAPENRMHLCETRGECLMGRDLLHSQSFYYRASLHFPAWTTASTPCTPASIVTPNQRPVHTLTHTWNTVMSCAERGTFCKLASAPRERRVTVMCRKLTLPRFSVLFHSATLKTAKKTTRCTVVCQLYAEKSLLREPLLAINSWIIRNSGRHSFHSSLIYNIKSKL